MLLPALLFTSLARTSAALRTLGATPRLSPRYSDLRRAPNTPPAANTNSPSTPSDSSDPDRDPGSWLCACLSERAASPGGSHCCTAFTLSSHGPYLSLKRAFVRWNSWARNLFCSSVFALDRKSTRLNSSHL